MVSLIIGIIICAALMASYYLYKHAHHVDLIVGNGIIITMNPHNKQEVITSGALAIRGNTLIAVGNDAAIRKKYTAEKCIDVHGTLIMPGLINAHTHAAMTLFRGIADNKSFHDWFFNTIQPLEKAFVHEDFVYWGTKLGCLEMIQGGITTVVDMYLHEDAAARAFDEMGIRVIAGQGITQRDDLDTAEAFIKKWAPHPRITPALAPHAPYSVSQEVITLCHELAKKYTVPLMMHLAETRYETTIVRKQHHMHPVEYIDSLGIFSSSLIAVHCVHIDDEAIALFKKNGVGVVHCPVSNMKLASGVAPLKKMLDAGISVGLGTDSPASNNSLDMFGEMKTAALLHAMNTGDPASLKPWQIVALATIDGAHAIGKQATIGSLEPGKKADIIAVDTKQAHALPLYDVMSYLVYNAQASDVHMVIIDGEVRMAEKKLTCQQDEIDAIKNHALAWQEKIAAHINA